MFRSSYDHHEVYKSCHVHVLIVHRRFTVKRNGIPLLGGMHFFREAGLAV